MEAILNLLGHLKSKASVGQPTLYAPVAFTNIIYISQHWFNEDISNFRLYSIICIITILTFCKLHTHVDNDHSPLFLVAAKRASRMAKVGQSTAQKVPLPRALQMRPGNFAYSNKITNVP